MTPDESIALYKEGREAWNAWAKEMREQRQALIDAGKWVESRDPSAQNAATRAWHTAATADFQKHRFDDHADFNGFEFPGAAWFGGARFADTAWFEGATFAGAAWFGGASFADAAWFEGASFAGTAWFIGASFADTARFHGATFAGAAWFDGASFASTAWFIGASFAGTARFDLAGFERYTTFEAARFRQAASFKAMRGQRAFSLAGATFLQVQDFEQAHFDEAPRLDNLRIEPRRFRSATLAGVKRLFSASVRRRPGRGAIARAARRDAVRGRMHLVRAVRAVTGRDADRDLHARWRSLKRLAVQGHDHTREQEFFKGEMKARRGVQDRFWQPVFLAGLAYQVLSDFGRSILRPALWLVLSTGLFAAIYLNVHDDHAAGSRADTAARACIAGPADATPRSAAIDLSIRRALLLPGIGGGEALAPIHACLYGVDSRAQQPAGKLARPDRPWVPATVGRLGVLQGVVSAILLFLLLLAIRNHFRIR